MHSMMKNVGKHVAALVLFLGLVMAYFSPAVLDRDMEVRLRNCPLMVLLTDG